MFTPTVSFETSEFLEVKTRGYGLGRSQTLQQALISQMRINCAPSHLALRNDKCWSEHTNVQLSKQ